MFGRLPNCIVDKYTAPGNPAVKLCGNEPGLPLHDFSFGCPIFKNVNLIKKNKYLTKDKKFFSGSKKLFVTDNGAAAAVLLGITLDKLQDYFKKLSNEIPAAAEQIGYVEKLKGIFKILPCDWLSTNHSVHPCRYQTSSSSIVSTNMQPISRHVTHSREEP